MLFLEFFSTPNKINQMLQHSFTLPQNFELMYPCNKEFCWLLWLKAYQGTILVTCKGLAGLILTETRSCSSIHGYSQSLMPRVLVTGLKAEVWTPAKNKQLNTQHVGHLEHVNVSKGITIEVISSSIIL